jgi:hypothetical protein
MTDGGERGAVMDPALRGRCLCGAVTLTVHASTGDFVLCHCGQCRKASGAAFQAVLPAACDAVTIDDPQAMVREYRSSADKVRVFCGRCGSPLFSRRDGVAMLRLRAGLFDDLAGRRPVAHIFAAGAAAWDSIADALPRHATVEPGREPAASTKGNES